MSGKLIVRIKGGLGNQMFQYAAARRLALKSGAELVLDTRSGFARDRVYRRRFMLDRFRVAGREATPGERLEPLGRLRRRLQRTVSRRRPLERRSYVEQDGVGWDPRVLELEVRDTVYLEGYWQSERYFADVAETIRRDFELAAPLDAANRAVADDIARRNAVAVHVRWFNPDSAEGHALADYYARAVRLMESRVPDAHFFVFSDDVEATRARLALPPERVTFVSHNQGDGAAHADLWLMSRCRHLVIANSTFSWWGAWLASNPAKIVVAPGQRVVGEGEWGFEGLIPSGWVTL